MEKIIEFDRELFLTFNGLHQDLLDQPMFLISGNLVWIPLHALLLFLIFKTKRQYGWIVLLGIIITVSLADSITSSLMKPLFMRLRPTWDAYIGTLVHTVNNYRGGRFGFPSSHAANTFGVTIFLLLVYRRWWLSSLLAWPIIVSYSRIYLGVHFPLDIMVGWIAGTLCAMLAYGLYRLVYQYAENKKTPHV